MKNYRKDGKKDFSSIDIQQFLNDFGINYRSHGKNIGRGWLGLECPFCGDTRNHFAVRVSDKKFNCWSCGNDCHFQYYLHLLGYNRREQEDIIDRYSSGKISFEKYERNAGSKITLPSIIEPIDFEQIDGPYDYLLARNYDWRMVEKYHLRQLPMGSFLTIPELKIRQDFQYRIFIPIFMNRRLVSFTARDWTDQQEPKYYHPVVEASIISTANCIYNYDALVEGEANVIVEGPLDVMRLGSRCAATMGTKVTNKQIKFLAKKRMSHLIILYDQNAKRNADKFARSMMGLVPRITATSLKKGDPGDLSKIEAIRLKQKLLRM